MTMEAGSKERSSQKAPNVSVLSTSIGFAPPELMRDIFKAHVGPDVKALIIRGWASGTVHKALLPLIRETTQKGVSVFVLSDNPAEEQGVRRLKYESHFDLVAAGAIILRDVNTRPEHADEIFWAIQDEIDKGKTGKDLNGAIIERFGTPNPQ